MGKEIRVCQHDEIFQSPNKIKTSDVSQGDFDSPCVFLNNPSLACFMDPEIL